MLKMTSRHVIHLSNSDDFHSAALEKRCIICGAIIYLFLLHKRWDFCHYAPCVFFPHSGGGDLGTFPAPPLPLLAGIIKSSLPPLPPLRADSSRCSSSGPVSSCYARRSLFSPPTPPARPAPSAFCGRSGCDRRQSGRPRCKSSLIQSERGPLLSSLMRAASVNGTSSEIFYT